MCLSLRSTHSSHTDTDTDTECCALTLTLTQSALSATPQLTLTLTQSAVLSLPPLARSQGAAMALAFAHQDALFAAALNRCANQVRP
jgi:hypothetical protein